MMEHNITEIAPEKSPIFEGLLDAAAKVRPIMLQTICWVVFGVLLAAAPSLTRWVVVMLAMVIVPGALGLRGRLIRTEARLRQAMQIERGAEAALQIAFAKVEELERELHVARRMPGGTTSDPVFRQVGLDADAPDYVIQAARRAHRIALHPDRQPPGRRQAAHERFVAVEAAFAAIARRRGT